MSPLVMKLDREKAALHFERLLLGKKTLTRALIIVMAALTSALIGCDDADRFYYHNTLIHTRTSPDGRYVAEYWFGCDECENSFILIRLKGTDAYVSVWQGKKRNDILFTWRNFHDLIVRYEQNVTSRDLIEGVQKAYQVNLSYKLYSEAEIRESLQKEPLLTHSFRKNDVSVRLEELDRACKIQIKAINAVKFEKIGLSLVVPAANTSIVVSGVGDQKRSIERSSSIEAWISDANDGHYRTSALVDFVIDGIPYEKHNGRVLSEEQNLFTGHIYDDDRLKSLIADDALGIRYVFVDDNKFYTYKFIVPLNSLGDAAPKFIACAGAHGSTVEH
jgi:hypothetical protein